MLDDTIFRIFAAGRRSLMSRRHPHRASPRSDVVERRPARVATVEVGSDRERDLVLVQVGRAALGP